MSRRRRTFVKRRKRRGRMKADGKTVYLGKTRRVAGEEVGDSEKGVWKMAEIDIVYLENICGGWSDGNDGMVKPYTMRIKFIRVI